MEVEEKIKRAVLLKELAHDTLLAHCFIKIHDPGHLYAKAYLGIACRQDVRPDTRWSHMPDEYRITVAAFAVETLWPTLSEEDQAEWLEVAEVWTSRIYKEMTTREVVRAYLWSEGRKGMAAALKLSYGTVYQTLEPKLEPLKELEKLTPIFDTRTVHMKTLKVYSEPRKLFESEVLRIHFACSEDESAPTVAAFYKWLKPKRDEYPDFSDKGMKARMESQRAWAATHMGLEGWEFGRSAS